jgi:hypothetical protein
MDYDSELQVVTSLGWLSILSPYAVMDRKLVKVNGNPMIECDFTCLHPNIAVALYVATSNL